MASLAPHCVGSTGRTFSNELAGDDLDRNQRKRRKFGPIHEGPRTEQNFSQAQFSNDGTSIITQNGPKTLRTFILPPELLDGSEKPHLLQSHVFLTSATPIQAYSIYPRFNLQDSSTTIVLSSRNDLPISLNNPLYSNAMQATYPLIHPTTEAYIGPSSLLWSQDGTHFVAGSNNQISTFDVSYPGSGPIATYKTAAGRREAQAQGRSADRRCKGVITALSASSDGILAAGTRLRNIALYAQEGSGELITSFSLSSCPNKGTGITSLAWSPCGTYLLVAERQSNGISVFDMRNTYSRVAWLSGRKAMTLQKLSMDVVPTAEGYEVWAGGTDGCVRMWRNPGSSSDGEGEQGPDGKVMAHEGPVASAIWHPQGAVMATCSGAQDRGWDGIDSSDASSDDAVEPPCWDNSLKIWTL